jgi:hypothetical protein
MRPFNQGMAEALGINQYLLGQGQPGLTIPQTLIDATGIAQPTNQSQYNMIGPDAFVPDWGPGGPPPADLNSPAGQAWLNRNWVAYETAGGMPTTEWSPTPTPAALAAKPVG